MLTKRLTYTFLTAATLYAAPMQAQDSLLLRDLQFLKQQDIWLTQPNNAALTRYATKNIFQAEAQLAKGNGGLVNYYESSNTLQGTVSIESFYRLNSRIVAFGSIVYDNWTGRNLSGSAFIAPDGKPFNLVEDSLTNEGKKHRDTYRLSGGVGVDIYQGISLGARVDYTAANYAKYKDLRHKNKLMDLLLTAGVYAPLTAWMNMGADYQYHRNTESLEFGTYGKSDKVYKTLIDYGTFFGSTEQFGNEGYTDKSREMPLFEDAHGGHFQLELCPTPAFSLFATVGLSHASGYYGRKSPFTITYAQHTRDIVESSARLACQYGSSRFHLDLSYSQEKLNNQANNYRGLINANNATYYEYYDPTETGNKRWRNFNIGATAYLGIDGELPLWTLTANYHWTQRQQLAYLYPYYRQQHLSRNEVEVSATRNLLTPKGVWAFMLRGAYGKGSGDAFEDGTFATPSTKQAQPATMEAFLYREYQYLTAPQYGIGGSVKYSFVFPGTQLVTYAKASADYRKANEEYEYSKGKDHVSLSLSIGCTF